MSFEAKKIRQFIIDNFLFGDEETLHEDTSFVEGGIMEPSDVLHLATFVEDTFGLCVADREVVPENLDSIDRVVQFVAVRRSCA